MKTLLVVLSFLALSILLTSPSHAYDRDPKGGFNTPQSSDKNY
jgi:hypothetical protein